MTYPTSEAIDYISSLYFTRLRAEAFDPDGQVVEVRFYGKGTRFPGSESMLLGIATNAPYAAVWLAGFPPDAGAFWSFYAIARDNLSAETRSQGVLQYVEREGLAHVRLTPGDGALVAAGTDFEFGAELVAWDLRGQSVPVGMYFDGEAYPRTFPPITNANPTVSVVITNIAEGEHTIYSFYPRVTHRVNAVKLGLRDPVLTWDGKLEFELVTAYPGRETQRGLATAEEPDPIDQVPEWRSLGLRMRTAKVLSSRFSDESGIDKLQAYSPATRSCW